MAIAVEELGELGVHTFIRVGTCGAAQTGIRVGDLVIATGAVRSEGTPDAYVPREFPAMASHDVVAALADVGGDFVDLLLVVPAAVLILQLWPSRKAAEPGAAREEPRLLAVAPAAEAELVALGPAADAEISSAETLTRAA